MAEEEKEKNKEAPPKGGIENDPGPFSSSSSPAIKPPENETNLIESKDDAPASLLDPDENKQQEQHRNQYHYQWPSIYEECKAMILASTLIYAFAEIRRGARAGKINKDKELMESFMTTPIQLRSVGPWILQNENLLKEAFPDFVWQDLNIARTLEMGAELELIVFDDEKSDKEMVYGIVLNQLSAVLCRILVASMSRIRIFCI